MEIKVRNDNESRAESNFCKCKIVGKVGATSEANRQSSEYSKMLSSKPLVKARYPQTDETALLFSLYPLVFIYVPPFCRCLLFALPFFDFSPPNLFICVVEKRAANRRTCNAHFASKSIYLWIPHLIWLSFTSHSSCFCRYGTAVFDIVNAPASSVGIVCFCGLLCVHLSTTPFRLIGCIQMWGTVFFFVFFFWFFGESVVYAMFVKDKALYV